MDNIQKSIIAVLCVAGFAALIVPSKSSFETKNQNLPAAPAATPQAAPAPDQAQEPEDENDGYASQNEEPEGPDEFETFGQPMNDAQPLGTSSNSNNSDSPQGNLPAGALNGSPTAGQNYADQVAGGSNGAQIRTNQPVE